MARSKKEQRNHELKVLNHKDAIALKDFGRFCNLNKSKVMEHSGISKNRFNTYIEKGLIERVSDPRYDDTYRTTEKGRDFIKQNYGINVYHSNGCYHDGKLYDHYLELTREQQETWMVERDLREEYPPSEGEKVCDGAYFDGEVFVVVEAVTCNYSQSDLIAHSSYAASVGGVYNVL